MSYNTEHNFALGSSLTACSSAFRKAPPFLSVRSFFISLLNHNLGRGCPELNEITALLIHIALGLTLKPCHGDFNKYARNIIDEKSSRYRKPAVNICRLLLLSEGHHVLQPKFCLHVFISLFHRAIDLFSITVLLNNSILPGKLLCLLLNIGMQRWAQHFLVLSWLLSGDFYCEIKPKIYIISIIYCVFN